MPIEQLLLGIGVLLACSILASRASGRMGVPALVPALVLFLVIGMLAGTAGIATFQVEFIGQAQALGVVALAFILFAGGLATDWKSVKPVVGPGLLLATVGVVVTAGLVGWFATRALGLTPLEGFLLGAIISSTDAAAVFAVLRTKAVGLQGDLKPLIELESGSNNAMAVFLTIGLIRLLTFPQASFLELVPMFLLQMGLGAAAGLAFGKLIPWLVNRLKLGYEGLYPVFTLAGVLFTYGATAAFGGNGFLAVYLAGMVMGNSGFLHKRSLKRFHDGLAWLMQVAMFITLGLLVDSAQLPAVVGAGLLVAGFLMLVARPMSVFLALAFNQMGLWQKALVSWFGLRGSVPIVLATFTLVAGVPNAGLIINLVFFVVLSSVLLQATSLPFVARLLKVDAPVPETVEFPIEATGKLAGDLVEVVVPPNSAIAGKAIFEAGLPEGSLVVLMWRNSEFLVPSGGSTIEVGDKLLVIANDEHLREVEQLVAPLPQWPYSRG